MLEKRRQIILYMKNTNIYSLGIKQNVSDGLPYFRKITKYSCDMSCTITSFILNIFQKYTCICIK